MKILILICLFLSYSGCATGEIIEGNEMERDDLIEMQGLGVEVD